MATRAQKRRDGEKLSFLERNGLLEILPGQGSVVDLRIIHDLRMSLAFTQAEHKKVSLKVLEGGMIQYNSKAAEKINKEVSIGERANEIIKESLETLEKKKILRLEQLPLYDRFVDGKEPSANGQEPTEEEEPA